MIAAYADDTQSLCLHCGRYIEYDSGNFPAWTHADTGYAECPDDETYAEPDPNYLITP